MKCAYFTVEKLRKLWKRPDNNKYGIVAILSGSDNEPEDGKMAQPQKKKEQYIPMPKKTYWHLYSLQTLESDKLARTINKILKQEYMLVK